MYQPVSGVAQLPQKAQEIWNAVYAGMFASYIAALDDGYDPTLTEAQNRRRASFSRAWEAVRELGFSVPEMVH